MASDNEVLINNIASAIRKLVQAIYMDSARIKRQYGVTGPQSAVLRNLIKNGPLSSVDISRNLFVTPSNITGIIDRLEIKDLVKRVRKKEDRRVAHITLTAAGKKLGLSLPDPIEGKMIAGLPGLDSEHIQTLAMAMNEILRLIDTDANGVADAPVELLPEAERILGVTQV
jgi:DNA-binding MarR family transcriptional regulator